MGAIRYLILTALFVSSPAIAGMDEESTQRTPWQSIYNDAVKSYQPRAAPNGEPRINLRFEESRSLRSLERLDSARDPWRRRSDYWPQDERKLNAPGHWNGPGIWSGPGIMNLPGRPRS